MTNLDDAVALASAESGLCVASTVRGDGTSWLDGGDGLRLLLREVFIAAGGTHHDRDEYDRTTAEQRRTVVLINPIRVDPTADRRAGWPLGRLTLAQSSPRGVQRTTLVRGGDDCPDRSAAPPAIQAGAARLGDLSGGLCAGRDEVRNGLAGGAGAQADEHQRPPRLAREFEYANLRFASTIRVFSANADVIDAFE